jgi:hypothetical protein
MQKYFYWAVVFPPGLLFLFVCYSYRRILAYKRIQIQSRMAAGEISKSYTNAFGSESQDPKDIIQKLFDIHYGGRAYAVPIFMNAVLATIASICALVYAGLDMNLPKELEALIRTMPASILAASAGAYVWGLYDVFQRYRTIDLSPISLHLIWWRFLLAPILTPLVTSAFAPSLQALVGFLIGAFPAATLLGFAKSVAQKNLNIVSSSEPAEQPNLQYLQGLTKDLIDRLAEEGFQSAEHLAQADPIRLLLRTSIEWKVILDIIDQAILFIYLGNKIETLRSLGFRGSVEVAAVFDDQNDDDPEVRSQAKVAVALMSSKLGESEGAVRNLIQTLYHDVQVQFIWDLWGEAALDVEEDDTDENTEDAKSAGTSAIGPQVDANPMAKAEASGS